MEPLPTFEQLLAVNTEKELRKLGSTKNKSKAIGVNGLRRIIAQGIFVEKFSLKGPNSYANLLTFISNLSKRFNSVTSLNSNTNDSDGFFISSPAKYIFALTQADTQLRRELLEVESSFFRSKEEAKKWRNDIAMIIHPDKCDLPNADRAYDKLDDIYKAMIGEE